MTGQVIELRPGRHSPERFVNAAELAELMGVSKRTVVRWTTEGCPSEQWGLRARRYQPSAVMAWAKERKSA